MELLCVILRSTILSLIYLVFCSRSQDVDVSPASQSSNLARLKSDLGLIGDKAYVDRHSRPVKNLDGQLHLSVYLIILHVHSLDEFTGTLKINGLAQMSWHDEYLEWNPGDYGGIFSLHIPNNVIWQPDLVLYNSVEGLEINHYGNYGDMLHVTNNGIVFWMPSFSLQTVCPIDHKDFPFDEHRCTFQMGSWVYPLSLLNLTVMYDEHPEARLINEFTVQNPLWEMMSVQSAVKNLSLDCCPEISFALLESKVQLRRRSPFHKYLFVVPSLMTMLLTLAVFWLSPNSDKKITLGCAVVLMQMMLLTCLSLAIPPGGKHIPKIVWFCGNSLIMSCLTVVISIIVTRLSTADQYMPIPSATRKLLSSPVRWFLVLPYNHHHHHTNESTFMGEQSADGDFGNDDVEGEAGTSTTPAKRYTMAVEPSRTCATASQDWLSLATAIDQICFYLYIIIYAIIVAYSFI